MLYTFKHFQTGAALAHGDYATTDEAGSSRRFDYIMVQMAYEMNARGEQYAEGFVYKDNEFVGYMWYYPTMAAKNLFTIKDKFVYNRCAGDTFEGVLVFEKWERPTVEECNMRYDDAESICKYEGDDFSRFNLSIEAGFDVEGAWPCEEGFDPLEDEFFEIDNFKK